jgi:hypothetical protein
VLGGFITPTDLGCYLKQASTCVPILSPAADLEIPNCLREVFGSAEFTIEELIANTRGYEGSVLDFTLFYQAPTPSQCKVKN